MDYAIGSKHWPGVAKTIEECGELQQALGKLMALDGAENYDHWDGSDIRDKIHEEVADVWAAIAFLIQHNLNADVIGERMRRKLDLFNQWHQEQT